MSAAPGLAALAATHLEIRARLQRWLEAIATGEAEAAAESFAAFDRLLRAHAAMEEALLLPRFVAAGLESPGCTGAILRAEHDKLRGRLDAAGAALRAAGAPIPPAARVALILDSHALVELLSHHDQRERTAFFPALDASLEPGERAALYASCMRSQSSAAAREASPPSSCSS